MTLAPPNRILREVVDIQIHGRCDGLAARSQMDRLCGQQLTFAIGELLDGWGTPVDQLVLIDKLQIDVSGISQTNIESELIAKIIATLKSALERRIGAPGMVKSDALQPIHQSLFEELLFFLENGYLPWSSQGAFNWMALVNEGLVALDSQEITQLLTVLQSIDARRRLATHFSEKTLSHIIPILIADSDMRLVVADISTIIRDVQNKSDSGVRAQIRLVEALLELAISPSQDAERDTAIRSLLKELISISELPELPVEAFQSALVREIVASARRRIETKRVGHPRETTSARKPIIPSATATKQRERTDLIPQKESKAKSSARSSSRKIATDVPIFIANAGLVIVAPYLPMIFKNLDLIEEGRVRDIPTALALLHYLVFGSDQCAEWDLVLNKILCGVPLELAIDLPVALSGEQKAEAELLLEAIIANWPALKNTTQAGLRATFLQREGALTRDRDAWQLRLTRTAFDVLMDRLPWTISMIQLPWMPWMLETDWADSQ